MLPYRTFTGLRPPYDVNFNLHCSGNISVEMVVVTGLFEFELTFKNLTMKTLKIMIVDPNIIMREAVKAFLKKYNQYEVVGEAESGETAILDMKQKPIDITLINLDDIDGITLISAISELYPCVKSIALSYHEKGHDLPAVMRAGASAFLLTRDIEKELELALEAIEENAFYYCNRLRSKQWKKQKSNVNRLVHSQQGESLLTEREKEVLRLIFKQYANEEIAKLLNISVRTVNTHKRNMMEKTGAKNMAGLLIYAINSKMFNLNTLA